jgi:hypothetical protein
MPTLKVLYLGTVRGKVGEGISENLGSYKCPNITDVKTTWPASSSDFLICIRYSEYSSVIFCNSCVLQLDKFFMSQVVLQLSSSSISDLVSSQIVL